MKIYLSCLILVSTLTFAMPYGVIESHVKWDKQSVVVCWGEAYHHDTMEEDLLKFYPKSRFKAFPKNLRKAVQDKIQSEYTIDDVGIEYIGWKQCRDEKEFDVIILTSFSSSENFISLKPRFTAGQSSMGKAHKLVTRKNKNKRLRGFFKSNDSQPHVFLKYLDKQPITSPFNMSALNFLKQTALHEFGHLSGLRHEQSHPRSKNDNVLESEGVNPEKLYETTLATSYDPNSIMNYDLTRSLACTSLNFTVNKSQNKRLVKKDGSISIKDGEINILDESLYDKTVIDSEKTKYKFKIKLSKKDKHSLKCLYKMNPFELFYRICHKDV